MAMEYDVAENVNFQSKEYLKRFKDPSCDPIGVHAQFLRAYHDFYQGYSHQVNLTNATVLEFGGGPTLYSLISASAHVKEIVFAEYAAGNRAEILKWRSKENGYHDWMPYAKYVTSVLEGNSDPGAVEDRQEMMREKMKDVIACDLKTDKLLEYSAIWTFDIVQTNLCFEAVCGSVQEYADKIKKLKEFVKPGGLLVSLTTMECSWYTCAGSSEKLYALKITVKELEDCYKNAGMVLKKSFAIESKAHDVSDAKGFHFIVAYNPIYM